ncbi:hypothetical protein BLNAU_5884 [Blattamonas nauphoetae]|uniref:Uncharacterized protein n=1 Tax=Blattamonas nauphoetae TaxID=2049346 RepID=A0ABQ9Y5V7_9EUKA|nr:hypothetical protein BLNAU_5884 [Blattamonas nauphoetae]
MNTVRPSAKRPPQPELHVNKQTSTSGQVSIHTIVFPFDNRSQRNESQHSIRAKSLPKRHHTHTKSKSLQMSGVPIKGSPPMKRNVKQGSQISSLNHKVQDKATCANKVTHGDMHTLPQQESIAPHQSASLTTVSSHPPTPDSLQIYTPFLNWHRSDPVTTDSKSLVFISLVSMVRDGYEFDEELLEKASSFLSLLVETNQCAQDIDSFIQAIGQGSTNPAAVFMDLMTVLLSSPNNPFNTFLAESLYI